MKYRGIINVDYTGPNANEYTRLRLALQTDGWTQVETSAFIRESDNIADLWQGVSLVAKQSGSIGILSALTFHIQASEDFAVNQAPTGVTLSPDNALRDVRAKAFPGD